MKSYMQLSLLLPVFSVISFCAGCSSIQQPGTIRPVRQQPGIAVPPAAHDNLTQVFATSPDIKTGPEAGSFALVPIAPYKTEIKGSNEVSIRNPNNFPVLVMIRCEEKGLHIEMPASSRTFVYLPDGGFQISYVFANVPNALMRGDHIRLPSINKVRIDIPVRVDNQH